MNAFDMQCLIEKWEQFGLKGIIETDGQKKWKDFCVVQNLLGGPTLPCDWIEFDPETRSVNYIDL